MNTLEKATARLLDDPLVAEKLRLADSYMLQINRVGKHFILPREHVELLPVIEKYSGNLPKFAEYVKAMRDSVPQRGNAYISLHELYRILQVRTVQHERRDRANRAMKWLVKNHPRLSTEERHKWLRKLEQHWGRLRMKAMEEHRRKTMTGRLSTEEREMVLKEFWKNIDDDIKAGNLPSGKHA